MVGATSVRRACPAARSALALASILAVLSTSSCDNLACKPTRTVAQDAQKVDLVAVGKSSVLRARLTSSGAGLPGKNLVFSLLHDQDVLYSAGTSTGVSGDARLDHKKAVSVARDTGLVRANRFLAAFAGDATYCPSSDTGELRIVLIP